jgi:flagellar basal-body rod protein FlgB
MRILDGLFDRTMSGLSRTMDLTWERNKAITSNIANAETPQYRAIDVSFGNELEKAFMESNEPSASRTNPRHLDVAGNSQQAKVLNDLSGATKPDGNNVDIDLQMGRLAHNSGEYANAARLIKRQLGLIRTAIRESR